MFALTVLLIKLNALLVLQQFQGEKYFLLFQSSKFPSRKKIQKILTRAYCGHVIRLAVIENTPTLNHSCVFKKKAFLLLFFYHEYIVKILPSFMSAFWGIKNM